MSPRDLRDDAVLELLYGSGMRVAELCGLDVDDLHLDRGVVTVTGKGDKQRQVLVHETCVAAVRAWLAGPPNGHGDGGVTAGCPLLQQPGQPARARGTCAASSTGGLPCLRIPTPSGTPSPRTSSTGVPTCRVVQELLGHASLQTTQVYTHVSKERLRAVYSGTHPRA